MQCTRNNCVNNDEPKDEENLNLFGYSSVPYVKCLVNKMLTFAIDPRLKESCQLCLNGLKTGPSTNFWKSF